MRTAEHETMVKIREQFEADEAAMEQSAKKRFSPRLNSIHIIAARIGLMALAMLRSLPEPHDDEEEKCVRIGCEEPKYDHDDHGDLCRYHTEELNADTCGRHVPPGRSDNGGPCGLPKGHEQPCYAR